MDPEGGLSSGKVACDQAWAETQLWAPPHSMQTCCCLQLAPAEQPLELLKNLHLGGPEGLKEHSFDHSAAGTRALGATEGFVILPFPLPFPLAGAAGLDPSMIAVILALSFWRLSALLEGEAAPSLRSSKAEILRL